MNFVRRLICTVHIKEGLLEQNANTVLADRLAEVGKVTLKGNSDEALSDEFLLKSNVDEMVNNNFLKK